MTETACDLCDRPTGAVETTTFRSLDGATLDVAVCVACAGRLVLVDLATAS